ncbi:hypothetical protein [Spiroplasma alleghenense]|uniref:Lipoprotein n=1 Tax=Spiroplasma alleghenense TaxID=216931 RepID=A0A345Z3F4_9MOLU|nr:hypothetical protein [Spiroplasma alleghenense]AXK51133.1 hypothetical protein SALLE_v1c04590 [Spiroplasma alleghenense]
MKKILAILASITTLSASTASVVACGSLNKWDDIKVDPPLFDVAVTGFEGTELKNVKIVKNQEYKVLESEILEALKGTAWEEEDSTEWSYTKNGIELKQEEVEVLDWTRNATYQVIVKSTIKDKPGLAIYTFDVENSMHIADNLRTTNIGEIDDDREKTILMALIFQNMNLIPYINEISDQYIEPGGNGSIELIKNPDTQESIGAKISSDDLNASDKGTFKGSVEISFKVVPKNPPEKPDDIDDLTNYPDIGVVQDTRKYSILMSYIISNFNAKLGKLSELVNDLDIVNITDTSATIRAISGSQYFIGSVDITFEIRKPD